jgi:hypothetical protein
MRTFQPLSSHPALTPAKSPTDPHAEAVRLILAGGRHRRGLQDDKGDKPEAKEDEPTPGSLVMGAIARRQGK